MFNDLHESLNGPDAKTNEPFPPMLKRTPSVRASSLQPRSKPARPRKSSVTENARRPKHQRQRSKDQKRLSHDRKAFSAEPQNIVGLSSRRWEDLLDAVGSATEEESRDLTPVSMYKPSSHAFVGLTRRFRFRNHHADQCRQ